MSRMFGPEASAWQSGYEAGMRMAKHGKTALKENEMTAEEAILHVKKIINKTMDEWNDMNAIVQVRHEAELFSKCIEEIEYTVNQVDD